MFHGWSAAGITSIAEASTHDPFPLGEDCERYPRHVSKAVDALRGAGIDGPYGMALGPAAHTNVLETSQHGGYPLLEHLREILGGPLVWAPGVDGAVVLSTGGGHFLFESGQDLSIGYGSHDAHGPALSGGELQLPRRDSRGRGRADALSGCPGRGGWRRNPVLGADGVGSKPRDAA